MIARLVREGETVKDLTFSDSEISKFNDGKPPETIVWGNIVWILADVLLTDKKPNPIFVCEYYRPAKFTWWEERGPL